QRILGLRQLAEKSAAALPEREKKQWEAYARGVNALMESQRDHLPLEFRVLRYQPKPWTVTDSMLCGANMVQALNHGEYMRKILRERVTAKVGPELAADLYPNASWRDRPPAQGDGAFDYENTTPGTEEQEQTQGSHGEEHEVAVRGE